MPRLRLALLPLLLACAARAEAQAEPRPIAVTIDDLPVASSLAPDPAREEEVTAALLAALARQGIPAVGFVNEAKLAPDGEVDPRRVALLRRWLDAGLELGNHTHSHPDLHEVGREAYEADVLRGERVTRPLVEAAGGRLRFFRHPFLRTGRDLETRRAFEAFLAEHGYRVAPVTIDNYDYRFAAAYDRAASRGDSAAAQRVRAAYLAYMEAVVAYYEAQTEALFGRPIPHVLLLHASALNAASLDDLAGMLRERGYAFAPLERVLEDPAYASEDGYTGPAGITWLHRWALTAGKRGAFFAGEPEVPAWIDEAAAPAR